MRFNLHKWDMAEGPNGFGQQKQNKKGSGSPQKPDGDFDWSKVIRTVFSWGAVIIAAVIVMQFMRTSSSSTVEITYDIYQKFLDKNEIVEAKIYKTDVNDYRLEGTLKEKESVNLNGTLTNVKTFSVTLVDPIIQDQVKMMIRKLLCQP